MCLKFARCTLYFAVSCTSHIAKQLSLMNYITCFISFGIGIKVGIIVIYFISRRYAYPVTAKL